MILGDNWRNIPNCKLAGNNAHVQRAGDDKKGRDGNKNRGRTIFHACLLEFTLKAQQRSQVLSPKSPDFLNFQHVRLSPHAG